MPLRWYTCPSPKSSLGGRRFQQVKIALAGDLVQPVQFIHEDLTPEDDTAAVIEKVFQSDLQALRDTQKALDIAGVARAGEAIRQASRVEIFGIIRPIETVMFIARTSGLASCRLKQMHDCEALREGFGADAERSAFLVASRSGSA
jgi:hypothetical protein